MKQATRFVLALAAPLLALQAELADAKKEVLPDRPTASETKLLPAFCQARLQGDAATRKSWEQQMGKEIFSHVHHYCSGLGLMNRARVEMDKKARNYYLQRASAQFAYVIKRWPPSYPLTIKAKTFKQQADSMKGKK